MLKEGKPVNTGDHIPYVICVKTDVEVQEASFAARAFHPDAVARSEGKLAVDLEWYLTQQILPPIARLCEPIEGTSTAMLADRLGLDGTKFNRGAGGGGIGGDDDDDAHNLCDFVPMSKMEDAEKFKGTSPWVVPCGACGNKAPFRGAVVFALGAGTNGAGACRSGLVCPAEGCGAEFLGHGGPPQCFAVLSNLLALRLREDKARYYRGWAVCDDTSCRSRTTQQSVVGNVCTSRGCSGRMHPEFGEKHLFAQLKYFDEAVDEAACVRKLGKTAFGFKGLPPGHKDVCAMLKRQTEAELEASGYNWVPRDFWRTAFATAVPSPKAASGK